MTHSSSLRLALCIVTMAGALAAGAPGVAAQQDAAQRTAWNRPVPPFRVIGNVYYVGAAGVSSFLIVTPAGSFLLDGALPETAPQIALNIHDLGFDLRDVKFLLNSHAHFDHAGGLAELKRGSRGALMVASALDAPALRAGADSMPAITVDRLVNDGDTIRLGSTVMTAHVTPGHTRGCTTWSTTVAEDGRSYRVLFHCSATVVDRLVRNSRYPTIVADYERTFMRFREMTADVLLGNHPDFFSMQEKRARMKPGEPNPFVDPAELARFTEQLEQQFRATLERERSER